MPPALTAPPRRTTAAGRMLRVFGVVALAVAAVGFYATNRGKDPQPRVYELSVTFTPKPRNAPVVVNLNVDGTEVFPAAPDGLKISRGDYVQRIAATDQSAIILTVTQVEGFRAPDGIVCRIRNVSTGAEIVERRHEAGKIVCRKPPTNNL